MLERGPDADDTSDRQQHQGQRPRQVMHLFLQLAFGFHDQPGTSQQRIGHDQGDAAEQAEGRQPIQRTAGISPINHRQAINESTQRHALEKGCGQGAADKGLVPDMPLVFARLEAEFEGYAAKNQTDQHEDQWQIQRRQYHRVRQRKGAEQRRTTEHQPGFVAVPDRRDSVHHNVAVAFTLDEGEENADPQVEAVHDHVHHDPEDDDNRPDKRKIDTHGSVPLALAGNSAVVIIGRRKRTRRRTFLAWATRVGFLAFIGFRPLAHQAHHVAQANPEQREIHHHKHCQGQAHLRETVPGRSL
ncbi:hypothetical protein D3C85_1068750 [compost metagenome]